MFNSSLSFKHVEINGLGYFPRELVNREYFQEVTIRASSANIINLTALTIFYSK